MFLESRLKIIGYHYFLILNLIASQQKHRQSPSPLELDKLIVRLIWKINLARTARKNLEKEEQIL